MTNKTWERILLVKLLLRWISWLKISRQGAAQFALFAMLFQVMMPLTTAVPVNADDPARDGQALPNYYLDICTAYGAQSKADVDGKPLDKVPSSNAPWDCPICKVQTALGSVPDAPVVEFIPSLPRGYTVAPLHETRTAIWSAAPRRARAPPVA